MSTETMIRNPLPELVVRPRHISGDDLLDDILDGKAVLLVIDRNMRRALDKRRAARWGGARR